MIDLSTQHVTHEDTVRLDIMAEYGGCLPGMPRAAKHDYGWFIFMSADDVEEKIAAMKAIGASDALVAIYVAAANLGGDLMVINFDSSADTVEGIPTFDW